MESLEPRSGGAEQYPTPLTDAALDRFVEEGAFAIFPLMRQLERDRAACLEALKALVTPDANKHIQRVKDELFRSAPEIEAMARAAVAKAGVV